MLEQCALAYRAIPVELGAGDQFKAEFLAISPNKRIPVFVGPHGPDGTPISLCESGAMLLLLAGKIAGAPAAPAAPVSRDGSPAWGTGRLRRA